MHYTADLKNCQEQIILRKLLIKKQYNNKIINYLQNNNDYIRATKINDCGTYVGLQQIDNICKIVKANFCRDRLCQVCAWRRQAKFVAQSKPILDYLDNNGYKFLFATLTIRNCKYDDLNDNINTLIHGIGLLFKRRRITRAWSGAIRSIELSYNHNDNTYHPHIHILIAVKDRYFTDDTLYISSSLLQQIWQNCCNIDYLPIVDIRKVDDNGKANIEVLKYSLKPTLYDDAIKAFDILLKHRRLISFTGVIAKTRRLFKCDDYNKLLDAPIVINNNTSYNLYKIDVTGGAYKFVKQYDLIL